MRTVTTILLVTAATTPAYADEAKERDRVRAEQDADAEHHLSQSGGDPWLVSSSASLFTRPSFFEGIKLSSDTTGKDATYSASIGASAVAGPISPLVDGLQGSAAYNVNGKIVSAGVKWSVDLRDVRLMSASQISEIVAAIKPEFHKCEPTPGTPDFNRRLAECVAKQDKRRTELYARATSWLPAISLAVGTGYNTDANRRDKSSATLAADLQGVLGPTTVVATANAEWDQLPPDMSLEAFRSRAGGGLQIADTFDLVLPFTVTIGGKLFACISNDCGKDSSVEVTAGIGVRIKKSAQLGITGKWAGSGGHIGDALAGLAFSYSFVPPASKSPATTEPP